MNVKKVEAEAPSMVVNLYKQAEVILSKRNFDPTTYKAAVIMTCDHSGSTEELYVHGAMQDAADVAFAAGLQFDDDGEVPFSFFDDRIHECEDMNLGNCRGYVQRHRPSGMGSTSYLAALNWIVETAGYGRVDLRTGYHEEPTGRSTTVSRGLFRRRTEQVPETRSVPNSLGVKATAEYPTFAIFVTDGEPNRGTERDIIQYLTLMSQLPIFVQFVGVGRHNFSFLRQLDQMDGRFVDNANFFDAKEADHDPEKMLELLLGEFPDYYQKARNLGLVTV